MSNLMLAGAFISILNFYRFFQRLGTADGKWLMAAATKHTTAQLIPKAFLAQRSYPVHPAGQRSVPRDSRLPCARVTA